MFIPEIFLLAVLFLADAYFSAAETALTALPRLTGQRLKEAHPKLAPALESWLANPGRLLTTVIVSSNLSIIAFSFVASAITSVHALQEASFWARLGSWMISSILSVMVLLAAEIAPKVVAKRHCEQVVLWVMPGLQMTEKVLGPLIRFLLRILSFLTRPFGSSLLEGVPVITEEDLRQAVTEGERGGILEKEEREMIHSIMEFGDTLVREVMVPRMEMACIPAQSGVEECLAQLAGGGYSRMPVYQDHFDNITGILYSKDFLKVMRDREQVRIKDILRPAMFVPETKKVSELFRDFKRGNIHMAIVVDEFGGTSGLVTLEDLLEEIVGEIHDEYDTVEKKYSVLADGSVVAPSRLSIRDLNHDLKMNLPEKEDVTTLGGLVNDLAHRVPRPGESVEWEGLVFLVLEGNMRKTAQIKIMKRNPSATINVDSR